MRFWPTTSLDWLEAAMVRRGFFVVAMTTEIPLMDRLPQPLVSQLRHAGALVVDLTVRNLAMSKCHAGGAWSFMETTEKLEGSRRVQRRCRDLLQLLEAELGDVAEWKP